MLGTGGIFTAYHIQYLLLDAELRAKISDNKMFLNVLCCLVVFSGHSDIYKQYRTDLSDFAYCTVVPCRDQLFCVSVSWK